MNSEFPRPYRVHDIGGLVRQQMIEADGDERAALARRFDLIALNRLTGAIILIRDAAGVRVTGQVHASGDQACVTSGEAVPFLITEQLALLFTETAPDGAEVELSDADLDSEPLAGDTIDLGEIAAQALALALDPYPRAPHAVVAGVISEEVARAQSSPFAVLKRP